MKPDVAIFSEWKNYWGTFREIVEELLARKVHFAYYTMDLHDPALLIDSDYMHSRLFAKNKAASFQKLAKVEAKVMLATTPNMGMQGISWLVLKGSKRLSMSFTPSPKYWHRIY